MGRRSVVQIGFVLKKGRFPETKAEGGINDDTQTGRADRTHSLKWKEGCRKKGGC